MFSTTVSPAADPFYCGESAGALDAPGTVVRARRVRLAWPLGAAAWQLAYVTGDLHRRAEIAVTTVVLPDGPARGLLSFQCAIDSVSPRCAPSFALRVGARSWGALSPIESPLIRAAVRRGWAVSVPDHGGLDGRFGAPREPGYRALDALRAARRFAPLGLDPDLPMALWGYSGGGLATVWAAEMAPGYAPELPIVGVAAGAPVGDPGATLVRLNAGMFAGFPLVFIAGLLRTYPEMAAVADVHVGPQLRHRIAAAADYSTLEALIRLCRTDIRPHLRHGLQAFLADPRVARVLADIRPGQTAPTAPLFVQQGVQDEVIDVADIDALVDRYRALGVQVEYRRVRRGRHLQLEFATARTALDWLGQRRSRPIRSSSSDLVAAAGN